MAYASCTLFVYDFGVVNSAQCGCCRVCWLLRLGETDGVGRTEGNVNVGELA